VLDARVLIFVWEFFVCLNVVFVRVFKIMLCMRMIGFVRLHGFIFCSGHCMWLYLCVLLFVVAFIGGYMQLNIAFFSVGVGVVMI
jgi:hypothetical protein